MSNRTILWLAAVAALSWQGAVQAESRPCECSDIPRLKSVLEQTRRFKEAWKEELALMYTDQAAESLDDLVKRARERAGVKGAKKVGGLDNLGRPVIEEELQDTECDIVTKSVTLHEMYHSDHYWNKVPAAIPTANGKQLARLLASSEAGAHSIQEEYLAHEVEQIRSECRLIRIEHKMKKVISCNIDGPMWIRFRDDAVACGGEPRCRGTIPFDCHGKKMAATGMVEMRAVGEDHYAFSGTRGDGVLSLKVEMLPTSFGGMEIRHPEFSQSIPFIYGLFTPREFALEDVTGAEAQAETKLGPYRFVLEKP